MDERKIGTAKRFERVNGELHHFRSCGSTPDFGAALPGTGPTQNLPQRFAHVLHFRKEHGIFCLPLLLDGDQPMPHRIPR